ncbi:EF hand [Dictyocaulus viviparus]|uniref:EF hand n=1 Tax=Dictyocaulus viviparus TaxID=29172 RepID=A0A0D8XKR3_DICVI|nr:EF hand [Dictyocaulus viviparus]
MVHTDSSSESRSSRSGYFSEASASCREKNDEEIAVNGMVDSHNVNVKHIKSLLSPGKHTHTPLIQASIPKETAIATHAALSGLSPEKERRWQLRELYDRLDIDNDGSVDIRDLTAALKHEMPHIPSRLAPAKHEKRLEVIFQDLDKNNDGHIDVREIKSFCNELGIALDDTRAKDILKSSKNTISWTLLESIGNYQPCRFKIYTFIIRLTQNLHDDYCIVYISHLL